MTLSPAGPFSRIVVSVFLIMAAGNTLATTQEKAVNYPSDLTIISRYCAADFVPNGDLSKPVWKGAEQLRFDQAAAGRMPYPEGETLVASLWTSGYIYFAFAAKYTVLNCYEGEPVEKERWGLWNRDVVEVFINPDPERANHYYEFEVAPNNQWIDLVIDLDKQPFNDASWNSGFEHATRIDEKNRVWTCEMRIPAASLSADAIAAGKEWRLNFYRADGPGDDSQRRFLSWSPLPGGRSFHQPASFGKIRFLKS